VISSGPCPGLTSAPSSTFHLTLDSGSLLLHPLRSLPLNNCLGFPHFGSLFLFRDGALSPVHCHGVPSGPVVIPTSLFPDSLPSKTMSSFLSSSSLGETNVIRKTTSVFHNYAILDREDIANAMEMLERSQDEQRQRLESRKQRGRSGRLHRQTSRTRKSIRKRDLRAGAGRGSRTPKTRRSADFESAASASKLLIIMYFICDTCESV
jgi:hypothetical protein